MSELIKHECGIALLRLRKPLEYYLGKYGTSFYALNKMHLMMQKQHNRGQDGAGIANVKMDMEPGVKYINRYRSNTATPIVDTFNHIYSKFIEVEKERPKLLKDVNWLKRNMAFTGEVFLGHLRYGTFGGHGVENLHPVMRESNWITKNLVLAGNFNMTNVDELFGHLVNPSNTCPTNARSQTAELKKKGNSMCCPLSSVGVCGRQRERTVRVAWAFDVDIKCLSWNSEFRPLAETRRNSRIEFPCAQPNAVHRLAKMWKENGDGGLPSPALWA